MDDKTLFEKHSDPLADYPGMYYCGKRIKTPNHVYGPEIRSHFLIVFVNEGEAVLKTAGGDIPIVKDNILVMFPGERIYYYALSDWSIQWIGVDSGIDKLFESIGVTKEHPVFTPRNPKDISRILTDIYEAQGEGSLFAKYKVQSLICEFFSVLAAAERAREIRDPVASAIRTIEYNYNNHHITVQGLADSLYLDVAYFSRLFKQKTGYSPKHYLVNVRLNKAKELLSTTDYSIKDIAVTVGFSDSMHLAKLFTRKEGIPPSLYRERNR